MEMLSCPVLSLGLSDLAASTRLASLTSVIALVCGWLDGWKSMYDLPVDGMLLLICWPMLMK